MVVVVVARQLNKFKERKKKYTILYKHNSCVFIITNNEEFESEI